MQLADPSLYISGPFSSLAEIKGDSSLLFISDPELFERLLLLASKRANVRGEKSSGVPVVETLVVARVSRARDQVCCQLECCCCLGLRLPGVQQ